MPRVVIEEYHPRWPVRYDHEREVLARVLGDRLVASEHIGSTAVPGLAAKPIIDIMAGFRTLADAEACIAPLRTLGYTFVPEAVVTLPDDRYFEKWVDGVEAFHLHAVEHLGTFWQEKLRFREYLRAHPDAVAQYEQLKRELAPQHTVGFSYARAKTDFIRTILTNALQQTD